MELVTYGGTVLSDLFQIANVKRDFPTLDAKMERIGDRNILKYVEKKPPTVSFTIIAGERGASARREAVRQLAEILLVDGFQDLSFSSDDGLYYKAIPAGGIKLSEYVRTGKIDVSFTCDSAAMYGLHRTAAVPSGGSVTIEVGGTYPTKPTIKANAAAPSGGYWGLRLDDADVLKLPMSASAALSVDCGERVARVAGAVVLPTLDSDWFELASGTHGIENHIGSGTATVEWTERWL